MDAQGCLEMNNDGVGGNEQKVRLVHDLFKPFKRICGTKQHSAHNLFENVSQGFASMTSTG